MSLPLALCHFCRDAHLLARVGVPEGPVDGRLWERVVSGGLWLDQTPVRQHAGTLGVCGRGSRSGVRHELDGIGLGPEIGFWVEAKARQVLHKADVAGFVFKVQDLYRQAAADDPYGTTQRAWWPILVSSEPTPDAVRRTALAYGVILCEPELLPLPVLLRLAGQQVEGLDMGDAEWSELVRLGEQAARPIQRRLVIDPRRRVLHQPLDDLDARDLGDLLYVMSEITWAVEDLHDRRGGEEIARRADHLRARFLRAKRVW